MKLDREELAERAEDFVRQVLAGSRLELTPKSELTEEGVRISLQGPDSELILAENARALYAINHLLNQIFYRQSKDGCNFLVDCGNYRQDRATELQLLAEKAAERVRISGMPVAFQPLPASERRIIHLALADLHDIRTESEGTGRRRRVFIIPA